MKNLIQWQNHSGIIVDSKDGYDVISCEKCGFKHIVPLPSDEDLQTLYSEDYYSKVKPALIKRRYEDIDWWNQVYHERYDTLDDLDNSRHKKILDVGSGAGFFLKAGQERGWKALGIEPSRQAFAHSRKLGVETIHGFLTPNLARGMEKFDVINMNEVLEHIPDPRGMIRTAHGLLNEGGIISISLPNDYNPLQAVLQNAYGYAPWWVVPPAHINYFNFDSLERLLTSEGFTVEFREGSFPMEFFLLMGENYVGNDELGRQCHARRKNMELLFEQTGMNDVKRKLYQALADVGIGRTALVFARKN